MGIIPDGPFIYPITDRNIAGIGDISQIVANLCKGGARLIQIREKGLTTREYAEVALQGVEAARPFGASIIINDRADVAKYVGAAGVHLGDNELTAGDVRKFLGPDAVIGVSCHSIQDIQRAQTEPIDYFAVGPVFQTNTKELQYDVVGLDLVRAACQMSKMPFVAIGGINVDTADKVIKAGANGLAVIGAAMSGDIERNTRDLIDAISVDKYD